MQEAPIITDKFRRQAGLCWLVILGENFAMSFWQLLTGFGFVLSLFLLDILPELGFWLHVTGLLVSGGLLGYYFFIGVKNFKLPTKKAVFKRLEENNNLEHQPLRSLDDDLISGMNDTTTKALWDIHRLKISKLISTLHVSGSKSTLAKADPYALRLLAGLILIIALVIAGADGKDRILASLMPDLSGSVNYQQIKISAWITPPVYTNMAPMFLSSGAPQNQDQPTLIEAPTGSLLVIQLSNLGHVPMLKDGGGGVMAFEKDGNNSYSYQQEVTAEDTLFVTVKDKILAQWKLLVSPDMPPQITFNNPPLETNRKSLHIAYKAYDDYGVEGITLRLRRPPVAGVSSSGKIYEYRVIIPANKREYIEESFLKNMAPHPWAGTQVMLELIAKDALDNQTISKPEFIILPQREFKHPVARNLIKLRTRLALNPLLNRHKVALSLEDIGDQAVDYDYNFAVHLGLRAAALRLIHPSHENEVDAVIDLLWELALRIEDGGLSLAEARLRDAQNAVMEALSRGASQKELSGLMDDLEHAMASYMQELVENMLQKDEPPVEMSESGEELTPQDLKAMLDRIRDLMQMGMKDAAQRMLSEMQQMMENMQADMPQQSTPQGMEALEMMQSLKDIMQGQRELLERSYRQMQQRQDKMSNGENQENVGGSRGAQSSSNMQPNDAAIQKKLRQELGDLMQRYEKLMQENPPAFERANRAMGRAESALEKGNIPRAVQAEGQSLDQLQSAARAIQEQIIERFSGEGALGQQMLGESGTGGRDPFGRKEGLDSKNSPEARGMTVPIENDFQRVRSIRDELRRRSGHRHRPKEEIDYIDRLLQPF